MAITSANHKQYKFTMWLFHLPLGNNSPKPSDSYGYTKLAITSASGHNISLHQYLPDTVFNGNTSAIIQQGDLTSVTI